MSVTPNIMSEISPGKTVVNKSKASIYWGEGGKVIITRWSPKVVLPQLEELNTALRSTSTVIAGGAVLAALDAVEYTDIDVFPLTLLAVIDAHDILVKLGYKKTQVTPFFWMYHKPDSCCRPVQLVLAHTDVDGDVQRLLCRFDLSVCQVAVYHSVLHSNTIALRDISHKVLRVIGTSNISKLISRIEKYTKRGYSSQSDETLNEI